ncbi:MAG: isoprenylcysteine carboxylmethyltransferase family protein [Chloroflexi bacterium]|nr:isoprenylcysteine carboxylmethyltransferase family protein [Chloroflexota bacterium]
MNGDNIQPNTELNRALQKRVIQIGAALLVLATILFASAGRIDWVWAWAYLGTSVAIIIVNVFVMPRELIAERAQPKDNVKKWDKVITTVTIFPTLAMLFIAGFDQRFNWSGPFDPLAQIMALAALTMGQGLATWAMTSNKFFSTVVRIQTDRGHQVVTAGPYHYVRHPGYVGFIIVNAVTPIALGSWWAFICAATIICLFIARTALEDRMLQNELEGYKEYAAQVRYRLLPGVW